MSRFDFKTLRLVALVAAAFAACASAASRDFDVAAAFALVGLVLFFAD